MDYNENIIKAVDIIRKHASTHGNINLSSTVQSIDLETIIPLINDLYGLEVELKDAQNAITIRDLIAFWDDSLVASLNGAIDILQQCAETNSMVLMFNILDYNHRLNINKAIPLLNDYYGADITYDDVKESTIVRELLSYWDDSLTYPYIEGIRIIRQCSNVEQIRLYNSLSFIHLDVEKSTRLLNEYSSAQISYKDMQESSSVVDYLSNWDDYLKSLYPRALEIVQRSSDTNTKVRLSSKLGTIKLNIPICVSLLNELTRSQKEYDNLDDSTTVEELLSIWEKRLKEKPRRHLMPPPKIAKDKKKNADSLNPLEWSACILLYCIILLLVFPNSKILNNIVDLICSNQNSIKWVTTISSLSNPETWVNLLVESICYILNIDITPEFSNNPGVDNTTFRLIFLIVLIIITLFALLLLLSSDIDDEINKKRISKHLLLSSFLTTGLLVITHCVTFNSLNCVFCIRLIVLFWLVYVLGRLEASTLLRLYRFKLNISNTLFILFSLTVVNFGLFYLISR